MTAGCSISGCENPRYGHGLCQKHYTRVQRYGDATCSKCKRGVGDTPEQRFWSLVVDHHRAGCVLRVHLFQELAGA